MWEAIFVKPVLNLLILIQNYMPGNDLGLAVLVFTIIVRLLMWPLIKKQIHQTRLMQKISPEITAIRAKAKGSKDRATMEKVNAETMAVYRKNGVNPFASIGTLIIQLPLFIAIYSAVQTAFGGTGKLSGLLYGPVQDLSYAKSVLAEGGKQVTTFADWADLAQRPFGNNKVYLPVLIIALVSILVQYLQVKQTLPAKKVKTDDPSEKLSNATPYIMVILFGWISLSVAGAISFYIGAGALVAIFQQSFIMKQEKEHAEIEEVKKPTVKVLTAKEDKAEKVVKATAAAKPKTNAKKTPAKKKTAAKKGSKSSKNSKGSKAKKK